ncbi:MAG: hypothetical protein HY290_29335 [Planctomycetia bacterium]|nr:hypothetical protein [Planctomycetia bacterium]
MIPQLDPILAWPWVILAAATAIVWRRVLLSLRLVTWALLTLLMFRPWIELTETDSHSSALLIAGDVSRSMTVTDGPGGATRRATLVQIVDDARPELENLGKDIEIIFIDFSKDVTPVDRFAIDAPGEQTAIGHLLDELPKLVGEKKLVGAILISDGAQRSLPPYDVDPRAAAERLAEQQVRVDTVGIGQSGFSDSAVDLSVEDLDVTPTVFVKNTVVVRCRIRALGAANQELTVRLLLENKTGVEPGKAGTMLPVGPPRKIKPTLSQEIIALDDLTFVAADPGEFKLSVEVVPLEGEPLVTNNSQTTFINVLKGGVNVAYFDAEYRFEQKFLRRIDESPDIQLDYKPVRAGRIGQKTRIEPEWFKPGAYDVYIIGSVPASVFGPAALKSLSESVRQGAGLLMIGGVRSFGPGGYGDTPLADELPVVMLRTELQNGDDVDPTLHYLKPLSMLPTQQGLAHFVMRLESPQKNLATWQGLPALAGANRFVNLKDGAVVLGEARETGQTRVPLLVAQEFGRSRTMAFAADSTWQWYTEGHHEAHQRFWQQVVLWLAHKDTQGDESVWAKLDTRRVRVGQPVNMTFGARDADKRPIEDAVYTVEVTDPDGKKRSLMPQRLGSENQARFLETRTPGDYRVHIGATRGGQPIGLGTDVRFIVYDQDLELHNPAADFALLEEITRITGGTNVPPGDFAAHLKKLSRLGLNVEVTRVHRILLWDNWPLLVLCVVLWGVEWFLRKRRGLV